MVPERKKEAGRFIRYEFSAIIELTNLVLSKKLPPMVKAYFIWLCSYAWESTDPNTGETIRNSCTIPLAAQADYFQVSRGTIGKWLKTLADLGLIRAVYIVKINKTGKKRKFKSYPQAWTFKNSNAGTIYGTEVFVLRDDIVVGNGRRRRRSMSLSEQVTTVALEH